jgi:peptidyl-dipeptidase A
VSSLPVGGGPEPFLAAYESVARPLRLQLDESYWRLKQQASTQEQARQTELSAAWDALHASSEVAGAIASWRPEATGLVERQLATLAPGFAGAGTDPALRNRAVRLEVRVEAAHNGFRARLGGRAVTHRELDAVLLRSADDRERRDAWFAAREVGRCLAPDVRELARLRNALARQLGFADHRHRTLAEEELEIGQVDDWLTGLERATDEPWARAKAAFDERVAAERGKTPEALEAWDYNDRFLQTAPPLAGPLDLDPWFRHSAIERCVRGWFASSGLPIGRVWDASDLVPRPGKSPHAFCIGVDNPTDVRVLANLDSGHRRLETALHEFGHAAYNVGISAELPWVLREPAHTVLTEGVAMHCARRAWDPRWLRDVARVPLRFAEPAQEGQALTQLVFLRWALVVTRFEEALYRDPEADLDAVWWELVGRLQGLRRPEGSTGGWAAKIHVACWPVYYLSYILGELVASQIEARVGEASLGDALGGAFAYGRSRPWTETLRAMTGADLSPDAWLSAFTGPD